MAPTSLPVEAYRLDEISPRADQHPADRAATAALHAGGARFVTRSAVGASARDVSHAADTLASLSRRHVRGARRTKLYAAMRSPLVSAS